MRPRKRSDSVARYACLERARGTKKLPGKPQTIGAGLIRPITPQTIPDPAMCSPSATCPAFPGDFTILADDGSPWAQARHCRSLADAVAQAAQRAVFSRAAADHAAWQAASKATAAAGCRSGNR